MLTVLFFKSFVLGTSVLLHFYLFSSGVSVFWWRFVACDNYFTKTKKKNDISERGFWLLLPLILLIVSLGLIYKSLFLNTYDFFYNVVAISLILVFTWFYACILFYWLESFLYPPFIFCFNTVLASYLMFHGYFLVYYSFELFLFNPFRYFLSSFFSVSLLPTLLLCFLYLVRVTTEISFFIVFTWSWIWYRIPLKGL